MDGSDSRVQLVERFFAGTGSSYDFMVNAATFGIDRVWKRRIVARAARCPAYPGPRLRDRDFDPGARAGAPAGPGDGRGTAR